MKNSVKWINIALIMLLGMNGRCFAATGVTEPENPATMALSDTHFAIDIPNFFFNVSNNLFTYDNINADLTTAEAKAEFLDRLDNGEFNGEFITNLKLGLTLGHFCLAVRPWVSGSINLKSGIPSLIFEGYEAGRTYEINGSKAEAIAAASLDLSYGRTLWQKDNTNIAAGLTLHYLRGLGVGTGVIYGNNLTPDEWGQTDYTVDVDYRYGSSGDEGFEGQGFLADLGILYQIDPWNIGLVVKNIGPGLEWNGLTHETLHYSGTIEGGPDGPELPEPESETTTTENATGLTTRIPIVIHLYGGWQLNEQLAVNLGMKKGAQDAWGISDSPLTYTGLEWQPSSMLGVICNVYSYQNKLGVDTKLQLKATIMLLNFAIGWSGDLDPNAADSLNLSFSTGLQF